MLNPNNDRLDYGQLLSAPDKYKLDFAIGTTYSLDLDALVGASLALGLSEDTDSKIAQNPIALLEALRVTGDKMALFCEAGQIHLPNKNKGWCGDDGGFGFPCNNRCGDYRFYRLFAVL